MPRSRSWATILLMSRTRKLIIHWNRRSPKVRRVLLDRCEDGRACAGPPRRGIVIVRRACDAEIGLVPRGECLGIFGAEEEPANALHAFHVAGALAARARRTGRDRRRAGHRDVNRSSTSDVR